MVNDSDIKERKDNIKMPSLVANGKKDLMSCTGSVSSFDRTLSRRFMVSVFLPAVVLAFVAGRYVRTMDNFQVIASKIWQFESNSIYPKKTCSVNKIHDSACSSLAAPDVAADDSSKSQSCPVEECHPTTGQHLLVDIKNADRLVLDSQDRLKYIMLQLFNKSDTTSLSTDCHRFDKNNTSCFGVSLQTRVTLRTWPAKGIILLDLFTCSRQSLLHLIPDFEHLFGGSEDLLVSSPRVKWSYKKRGFNEAEANKKVVHATDTMASIVGDIQQDKMAVASFGSESKKIDVWDVFGSAESERILFLNNIIQSRQFGEAAYHEALVHPVMLLNRKPARIAIIGGDTGATLREVLKHNTVKEVELIGVDQRMVEVSREYLLQWSDCSNLVGSTPSCFDDPRVEFVYEEATSWFINNFFNKDAEDVDDLFDVIIVDIMHPSSATEYLLQEEQLLTSLYNSLSTSGAICLSTGTAGKLSDNSNTGNQLKRETLQTEIEDAGFQSVMAFSEGHSPLRSPSSFLAVVKDFTSRAHWFSNEAEANLFIHQQTAKTKIGDSAFHYFDGATMMSYKFPSRIDEVIYCRGDPKPEGCKEHGFDPFKEHFPASSFEVKHSLVGEKSGRGVFAMEHIPEGAYMGLDDCVNGVYVGPFTTEILGDFHSEKMSLPYWNTFVTGYIEGYGWSDFVYGIEGAGVDPGILTFMNHGCNGTYNTGTKLNVTEQDAELGIGPLKNGYDDGNGVYNPLADRMFPMWDCSSCTIAFHDIDTGEELLDNYLVHSGFSDDEWDVGLAELKMWCSGESVGTVTAYEKVVS